MPTQIIMDHTGDSRHEFTAEDKTSMRAAEERFARMTGKGFAAVALGPNGAKGNLIRAFDPAVETTLFVPPLQGG